MITVSSIRENQGAVGLPFPSSLIIKPLPPVTGALGVIGLSGGPHLRG